MSKNDENNSVARRAFKKLEEEGLSLESSSTRLDNTNRMTRTFDAIVRVQVGSTEEVIFTETSTVAPLPFGLRYLLHSSLHDALQASENFQRCEQTGKGRSPRRANECERQPDESRRSQSRSYFSSC